MSEPLIYSGADIRGRENIVFGEGVVVQRDVWLEVQKKGKLIIGNGANIGRRSVIGVGGLVEIGENVLIAPDVYIADVSHRYQAISVPIAHQGIVTGKPVKIGAGSWIGRGSAVMASVGKNSVIGANSVVTKPIPDFVMACGQPAIIKKRYSLKRMRWERYTWLERLVYKLRGVSSL